MNVLVISHTYISQINRDKWKTLAIEYPNVNITVIFPSVWPTQLFSHKAGAVEEEDTRNCHFKALAVYRAGNEILYAYHLRPFLQVLRTTRPDVIHVEQGDNALSYFQAIICTKLLRLNCVFVFFTWVNWVSRFSLKYTLLWRWVERLNLRFSTGAITGNCEAQRILRAKKFKKPILVLPQLGVNLSVFFPQQQAVEHKNFFYVGYIGRLVEEKGVAYLVYAFSKLESLFPSWRLIIVGRGPDELQLRELIKEYNLEQKVEIKATVSHYEVAQIIQSLEILVLPSFDTQEWKEQFGHILIEAMACSIPVIGSDAGEIPNVIGDAGLVFKQKNVHSLRDSLQKLMHDEQLRNELGEKGLQKVQETFSHQAIAHATYNFWQSLREGC